MLLNDSHESKGEHRSGSYGWLSYGLISMNILVFVAEFLLGYGILTSADLKVSNLKLDG